jgi:hypothetical protein
MRAAGLASHRQPDQRRITMTTHAQRIVEQYREGVIDRRQFTQALAAAGLTLTMVPLVSRPALAETDLTVFEWSEPDRDNSP